MQAGTPFNITYSPNSAQAVSPQISATYRGANEYRPDHMPGQAITQGISNRAANSGYVNYINPNAFVLPPIKNGAGNFPRPTTVRAVIPPLRVVILHDVQNLRRCFLGLRPLSRKSRFACC